MDRREIDDIEAELKKSIARLEATRRVGSIISTTIVFILVGLAMLGSMVAATHEVGSEAYMGHMIGAIWLVVVAIFIRQENR